jgi:hypothetical protein
MWFHAAHWDGASGSDLPAAVFHRLRDGELNTEYGWRSYGERSEALADLEQAMKDPNGNFR